MSFFQVDDALALNPKAQTLARRAMTGDVEGVAALGLWTLAGSVAQAKGTDGVVDLGDLVSLLLNVDVAQRLASELVAAGLWHTAGHDCHRCPPVPEGSWYFHDWSMMRYERGQDAREKRAKTAERNSKRLHDQVWARDRIAEPGPSESERALCAYCLAEVKRDDRRSEQRPEVDHVEPRAGGLENLVIACHQCNRRKGDRRPADAGMTLHVTERHRSDLARRGYRFELVTGRAAPVWAVLAASDHSDAPGAQAAPVSPAQAPTAPVTAAPAVNGPGAHGGAVDPNRGEGAEVHGSDSVEGVVEPNPEHDDEWDRNEWDRRSVRHVYSSIPGDVFDAWQAWKAGPEDVPPPDLVVRWVEKTQTPHRFVPLQPDPSPIEVSRACAGPRTGARGRRQGRAGQGREQAGEGRAGSPPPTTHRRRRGRKTRRRNR